MAPTGGEGPRGETQGYGGSDSPRTRTKDTVLAATTGRVGVLRNSPAYLSVPPLTIDLVTELTKGGHRLTAGDAGDRADGFASTTSSSIGGGMGSPCAFRLSI
jgi:hypothetical protein